MAFAHERLINSSVLATDVWIHILPITHIKYIIMGYITLWMWWSFSAFYDALIIYFAFISTILFYVAVNAIDAIVHGV